MAQGAWEPEPTAPEATVRSRSPPKREGPTSCVAQGTPLMREGEKVTWKSLAGNQQHSSQVSATENARLVGLSLSGPLGPSLWTLLSAFAPFVTNVFSLIHPQLEINGTIQLVVMRMMFTLYRRETKARRGDVGYGRYEVGRNRDRVLV